MTLNPRLAKHSRVHPVRRTARVSVRLIRAALAMLLTLGVALTASACGMGVQTNRPYTPAEGVNFEVGTVQVRSLMILSKETGEGILVASLVSSAADSLVGASGTPIKPDSSPGAPFTAKIPAPIELKPNVLLVLTDLPLITMTSPDLVPGLTSNLVLRFSKSGELNVTVPVVTAEQPDYDTITPSAPPST